LIGEADTLLRDRRIVFATGNEHKAAEVGMVLMEYGISVKMEDVKPTEIQSEDLTKIAANCAEAAAKVVGGPTIVEDSGLFIEALSGFPGPYSSYVYGKIGTFGILRLMEGEKRRDAVFKSAIAYADPFSAVRVFEGNSKGNISLVARGSGGFGFDPIFEPIEHPNQTFAEMDLSDKNKFSHRARAARAFASWYVGNR
jgi:XTP/dITP diphosphohydrolase